MGVAGVAEAIVSKCHVFPDIMAPTALCTISAFPRCRATPTMATSRYCGCCRRMKVGQAIVDILAILKLHVVSCNI